MSKDYPRHIAAVRMEAALRVRPFVSKDGFRYYLSGALIESCPQGGALCVATDGYRLGVRHDPNGLSTESAIVRLPKMLKVEKKPKWLVVTLTEAGKGFVSVVPVEQDDTPEAAIERVESADLRIGDCIIDGTFPDWRRVMPKASEGNMKRAFRGEYVASFVSYIHISGEDETAAHLVSDDADPEFVGVLMPMRANAPKLPNWLAEAAPEPKRKAA